MKTELVDVNNDHDVAKAGHQPLLPAPTHARALISMSISPRASQAAWRLRCDEQLRRQNPLKVVHVDFWDA
eukprot:8635896-Pyramimonas_sp.AAC.1